MQLSESYLLDEEWEEEQNDSEEQLRILGGFAKECITCFFLDKQYSCGGPIPAHILYYDKNVNMVMQTSIVDGINRVYKTLEKIYDFDSCAEKVLNVLNECGRRFIPKEFAAGLMIMYFRLCEGLVVE